jgi:hypothetical protein
MNQDSQTNIRSLDEANIHQTSTPSVTLATLGINGATEYSSGKKYHRYIPVLNDQGRLDSSFLSGVEVTIAQKTTGSYYYVDLINGDDYNSGNGSVQNPYKSFSKASDEGFKNDISTFILKSGKPESQVYETISIPDNSVDAVYITSDGYSIAEIPALKIDITSGKKTVYVKDITIGVIFVNALNGSSINLYLLGSSTLNGISNTSVSFDVFTSADAVIGESVDFDKINKLHRLVSSENIQYNEDSSLNDHIDNHIDSKENPHSVTAAQVGALSLYGGVITVNTDNSENTDGCIYYNSKSDETKIPSVADVNTTVGSRISSHNEDANAHTELLNTYVKLDKFNETTSCLCTSISNLGSCVTSLDKTVQQHTSDNNNPHNTSINNLKPDVNFNSRIRVSNSTHLEVLNDMAIPIEFRITDGGFMITDSEADNFESSISSTGEVFKRYPYSLVSAYTTYSKYPNSRNHYYFKSDDFESLMNQKTGGYIQLSESWLKGHVYLVLVTGSREYQDGFSDQSAINHLTLVPNSADKSVDESDIVNNMMSVTPVLSDGAPDTSSKPNTFVVLANENKYLEFLGDKVTFTANYGESISNGDNTETSLVLTSRDIDTAGILNCIGEIKGSIDGVNNKTSSLESNLNEFTDRFDDLEDALLNGGEVTIIATETKAIVSEDKKTTVSISEDNRLEMCVKSTLNGVDTYSSTYFLTESYDANTVTPLIERVDTLESKTIDLFFPRDQLVIPSVKPPSNPCIDITGAGNIVIGKDMTIYTDFNMAIGKAIQLTQYACNNIAIGNQISMRDTYNVAVGSNISTDGTAGVAYGACIKVGGYSVALGGYVNNDNYYAPCNAVAVGYGISGCESSVALGSCISQNDLYNISIGNCINSGCYGSVAIGSCINASYTNSIVIGGSESAVPCAGILIGCEVSLSNNYAYSVGVGKCIQVDTYNNTYTVGNCIKLCASYQGNFGLVLGQGIELYNKYANSNIAIGSNSCIYYMCASINDNEFGGVNNISIGDRAYININGTFTVDKEYETTIQLGTGTNTNLGSLQFKDYPLFDSEGKLYPERLVLSDISNGKKYQLTVTNGVLGVTEVAAT